MNPLAPAFLVTVFLAVVGLTGLLEATFLATGILANAFLAPAMNFAFLAPLAAVYLKFLLNFLAADLLAADLLAVFLAVTAIFLPFTPAAPAASGALAFGF